MVRQLRLIERLRMLGIEAGVPSGPFKQTVDAAAAIASQTETTGTPARRAGKPITSWVCRQPGGVAGSPPNAPIVSTTPQRAPRHSHTPNAPIVSTTPQRAPRHSHTPQRTHRLNHPATRPTTQPHPPTHPSSQPPPQRAPRHHHGPRPRRHPRLASSAAGRRTRRACRAAALPPEHPRRRVFRRGLQLDVRGPP